MALSNDHLHTIKSPDLKNEVLVKFTIIIVESLWSKHNTHKTIILFSPLCVY